MMVRAAGAVNPRREQESMTPATTPVLRYADASEYWGASVQRWPAGVRVVVPPVAKWYQLDKSFLWVLIPVFFLVTMLSVAFRDRAALASMLPNLAIYGSITAYVLFRAWTRLRRRIIFDVTRRTFTFYELTPTGVVRRRHKYPRADVLEVKLNPSNNRLWIHVRGRDFVDRDVSPDPRVVQFVADELHSAIFTAELSVDSDAGAFPVLASSRAQRLSLAASKGALLLLVLPGIVLSFLGGVLHGIGCVAAFAGLVAAGIFAGMALGTQDKEFYF